MCNNSGNTVRYLNYKYLTLILVVAASLRFGLLTSAYLHRCDLVGHSDEHGYHLLAVNLAQHQRFTMAETNAETGRPDIGRTPGFPALVALVYLLVGLRPYAAAALLALISCCTVYLVYLISLRLFGEKPAVTSGLLMAVTPAAILYAGAILTDTLHTALITLSLLSVIGNPGERIYTRSTITGFWLGLAALVRPITAYLPVVLAVFLLAIRPRQIAWLLMPIIAYLVISPWCLRNLAVSGRWQLSSIGRYNLTYYNLAFAKAKAEGVSVDQVRREYHDLAKRLPGGSAAVAKREIPKYWPQLLLNQAFGAIMFWIVPDRFQWGYFLTGKFVETRAQERLWDSGLLKGIHRMLSAPGAIMAILQAGINLVLLALATIGLVGILRKRMPAYKLFATTAIVYAAYYALLTGPVACGRYHMAVEPLIAILAGTAVANTLCKLSRRDTNDAEPKISVA